MRRGATVWLFAILALPSQAQAGLGSTAPQDTNQHEFLLGTTHLVGKEGISFRLIQGNAPRWDRMRATVGYRLRRGLSDRLDVAVHLNYLQKSGPFDLRLGYQLLGGAKRGGLALRLEGGLEALINDVPDDFLMPIELSAGLALGKHQVGFLMGMKVAPSPWSTGDSALWLGTSIGIGGRIALKKRILALRLTYLSTADAPADEPGWDHNFAAHVDGVLFTEFGIAF